MKAQALVVGLTALAWGVLGQRSGLLLWGPALLGSAVFFLGVQAWAWQRHGREGLLHVFGVGWVVWGAFVAGLAAFTDPWLGLFALVALGLHFAIMLGITRTLRPWRLARPSALWVVSGALLALPVLVLGPPAFSASLALAADAHANAHGHLGCFATAFAQLYGAMAVLSWVAVALMAHGTPKPRRSLALVRKD